MLTWSSLSYLRNWVDMIFKSKVTKILEFTLGCARHLDYSKDPKRPQMDLTFGLKIGQELEDCFSNWYHIIATLIFHRLNPNPSSQNFALRLLDLEVSLVLDTSVNPPLLSNLQNYFITMNSVCFRVNNIIVMCCTQSCFQQSVSEVLQILTNYAKDMAYFPDLNCCSSMKVGKALGQEVHSNLHNSTFVATKVHVILWKSAMLTWMHNNKELI